MTRLQKFPLISPLTSDLPPLFVAMTARLTEAVSKAAALPDDVQDAVAARLLAESEAGEQWDAAFATEESDAWLTRTADAALEDLRNGKTESLDPADLDR